MARRIVAVILLMGLSACISNGQSQRVHWDEITSQSAHVAQVTGIKSLINPGFY